MVRVVPVLDAEVVDVLDPSKEGVLLLVRIAVVCCCSRC